MFGKAREETDSQRLVFRTRPISGTGLSSGIMRLALGLPGHGEWLGIASRGTRLALLRWPAGASSGLLTP